MAERSPDEFAAWVKQTLEQLGRSREGTRVLRLKKGLAKQLVDELYPLVAAEDVNLLIALLG